MHGTHLIVTITGDLNARPFDLHVHHQAFHHGQRVLVVTEVLKQAREKRTRTEKLHFEFHVCEGHCNMSDIII